MDEIIELINREANKHHAKKRTSFRRKVQSGPCNARNEDDSKLDCSTDETETCNDSFSSMLCNLDTSERRLFAPISSKRFRRVTFSEVQIRVYEQVLSFNPACSEGAAIEIGWKYRPGKVRSVDEFEMERPPPVGMEKLALSKNDREAILARQGYSAIELAVSQSEIRIAQMNRMETIHKLIREEKKRLKGGERLRGFPFFRKRRQENNLVEP